MKKGSEVILDLLFYSASEWLRQVMQVPAMKSHPELAKVNYLNAVGVINVLQRIRHEEPSLWSAGYERAFYDLDEDASKVSSWLQKKGF